MSAYKLIPFSREMSRFFEVEATVERRELVIALNYKVSGDMTRLFIPKRNAPLPQRMGGLWESTCFELFLRNKRSNYYLEFNLAPTGNWNCFSFEDYRDTMREYSGVNRIDITFRKSDNHIILSAEIELKGMRLFQMEDFEDGDVKAGLSCVLENTQQLKSYWALKHYGKKPDFHTEENFNIKL